MKFETPYYLIDEARLVENLKKISFLKEDANIKSVLALKCFSTWSVFETMRQYMDGTTSSSLYEALLGYEEFGKEVHVYSAAFSKEEINELKKIADVIIFNSISQLKYFYPEIKKINIGLRINPQVSCSNYELADPSRRYSRLGVTDYKSILKISSLIKGVMFHCNCENDNFDNFSDLLDKISRNYSELLSTLDWVSLGGGISFNADNYPLKKFSAKLKKFSEYFNIQVYIEPGEAVVTNSSELITTVLDIVYNETNIAVVDCSTEAHMLDLLIYRETAKIKDALQGKYRYIIAGKSCLAGDIFGEFNFDFPLKIGDRIHIANAGGYTMVTANWFNGLKKPSIVVKRLNGNYEIVKSFFYQDFKNSLS